MQTRYALTFAALLTCLAVALPHAASAQGLRSVYTKDGIDVIAVGDAGEIYRSYDGGVNWTERVLGARTLRGVSQKSLVTIVVSDSGKIWRSTNNGGAYALDVRPGAPDLFAVAQPTDQVAYVVGAGGTILKSIDGGATWASQPSGTGAALRTVRFVDATNGWAGGDNGTLLRTTDGATWNPVGIGTTNAVLSIDQNGGAVWVVGANGTARASTDGGNNFTPIDLKIRNIADVTAVRLASPTDVTLTGGGGFIRRSTDAGVTWTFQQHPMQAYSSDLRWFGSKGWMVNRQNRSVIRTTNGGGSWSLPFNGTVSRSWTSKIPFGGSTRGNSLAINGTYKNVLYAALGGIGSPPTGTVYKSRDDGETWTMVGSIPQVTKVNAFVVSPKDSLTMVAALSGYVADRLARSTDGGATWSDIMPHEFGEYGIPIEMHPDRTDTLYFGGEANTTGSPNDSLWCSPDFGKNWSKISGPVFRSPCDIVCLSGDSSNVILIGDGVTGSGQARYFKSSNNGQTFTLMSTRPGGASEIPGMATSRLRPGTTFGTNWSSGGVQRSDDYGATWPTIQTDGSAWGIDVAKDDPNCMVFGVYSGGTQQLSLDGGNTKTTVTLNGNNYSFFARDRATIICQQSSGIYKLAMSYGYTPTNTQALAVTAPNGGESYLSGNTATITWSNQNIGLARIEYRSALGQPWQLVAEVPGYLGSYDWTCPNDETALAKLRISDAWDGSPADSSDAVFSIHQPSALTLLAPDGGETWQYGSVHPVMWSNTNVADVSIEYQTSPNGVWNSIVATTDAAPGSFAWSIPFDTTETAVVRVRQVGGGAADQSLGPFRLTSSLFAAPAEMDILLTLVGSSYSDVMTIQNPGSGPLTVTSVASSNPRFVPGRTSFVIPPRESDTLSVTFSPVAPGADSTTLTVTSDDPFSPHDVLVRSEGTTNVGIGGALRPTAFAIGQNRPNPFRSATLIDYALPQRAHVTLGVYNLEGRRVATLVDGEQEAGRYAVPFGSGVSIVGGRLGRLPSGVYFYRFNAGPFHSTKKMLLVR